MVGHVEKIYPKFMKQLKQRLPSFREIIEANGLRMHGTTLGAVPPFTYWSPGSLQAMALVRRTGQRNSLLLYNGCRSECQGLSRKENLEALKTF